MSDQPVDPELIDDEDVLPTPAASASTRVSRAARRRATRRRTIIVLIAAVVALSCIGVGVAYAATRPTPLDQRYVTVAATTGDLTQTLSFTGTVTESNEATASFPASGKVTSVDVTVGDTVKAGQALATMDKTALQQAVDSAQATLDQAKLTLQQLTTSSSSSSSTGRSGSGSSYSSASRTGASSSSSSTPSASGTPSGGGSGSPSGGQGQVDTGAITPAIAALTSAQAAAATANTAMKQACDPLLTAGNYVEPTEPPSPTPTPTPTDEPTGDPGDEPTDTPTDEPTDEPTDTPTSNPASLTAAEVQACTNAIATLQSANTKVSKAANTLSQLGAQYAQALDVASALCQASIQAAATKAAQQGAQAASSQIAQSLAQSYTGGSASSSQTQKVAAQIAVDQAQEALTQAQLNLANATLTSPIDGVVATLPFKVGATMSASDTATIVGSGGVYVVLSVTVAQIAQIQVGQTATITELGVGSVTGAVTVKNLAPAAAGGSTYAVTVAASGTAAQALLGGVTGQVTITVGQLKGVVLVPVSAVMLNSTSSSGTVEILANNQLNTVDVQITGIGATQVAIGQGVNVGDMVVVADTQEALPSSLAGLTRALSGGGGGGVYIGNGTGGGGPGGGFPGGTRTGG